MKKSEVLARITEMVTAMASVFPAAQMGDEAFKAYARMLQDQPLDVLKVALDQLCVENKFLPSVAEIRDKVITLTTPDRPPALQAWRTVTEAIGRYGYNHSIKAMQAIESENPIAAEAARCLGWQELCMSENQVADRAHFSKIYDQLAARKDADERLLPAARSLKLTSGLPVVAQLAGKK